MDIRFLKTLHLIAELGSMAQAARHLEISPAAVAHQLRTLESDLGAALVARSGRTVMPTAAGHRLLNHTRPLLAQLDEARACVHDSTAGGELKLGSINSALLSILPTVLARYAADYPNVRLRVHADVSPDLFQKLQDDAIDAAICQHPPFELPKTFRWAQLREEPLVVLAHRQLADAAPSDLLRGQPFIRYDRKLAGGKQADTYLRTKGIAVRETCELDSLLAIALMVHQRLGVSLVPRFQSLLTASLDIVMLAPPDDPTARSFGLLWKTASPKSMLIQALLDYAKQHSQEGR